MTSNYSAPFQKSKYLSLVLDTMDSTEANQIESFSPSEAPQPVDAFQSQTQQLQASDTFLNGTTYSNPSYPSKTSFSSASGLYNTLDVDSCFMSEPGGYTALGLQKRKYEHDSTACDPRPSNRPRIAPDSSALEYVRTDDTSVKEFGLERAGTFESSTTLVDIGFLLNGGGEEICTMSSKVAIEPIDNARHTNEGTKTTALVSKSQSKITSHKNSTHIITTQPIPNSVSSQIVTLTPGESPRKELEGVNRSDKPETTLLNRTPSLSPTCPSEDEVLSSCRSKSPTVDPPPNPSKTEFNSVATENYKSISADIQPYTQPTISHQQLNQQSETRFISFEGLDDCDSVQLTASELGDDDVPPSPPPTQPHTPFQSLQHHFIQPPITLSTTQFSPPTSRFLHSRELRILIKNLATPKPVLAFLYSETPGKTTTLQQYINHDPDVIAKRYQHVLWLSCLNLVTITTSLRGILRRVGVRGDIDNDGEEALCEKFWGWMKAATNTRYLLVVDGVENVQVLESLFRGVNRLTGHVIVTMRGKEGVEGFMRKSGAHSLLIPMGGIVEADLHEFFLRSRGGKGVKNDVDFSAVNHIVEEVEGDALYAALVKSYLVSEDCSCEVLVERMLVVKAKLEGSPNQCQGTDNHQVKKEDSTEEIDEDEEPLLYLTYLLIESILRRYGNLGLAAVTLLEIIAFTSSTSPVSCSSLKQLLDLHSSNQTIIHALTLLHSKSLLRLHHVPEGHENTYTISHPILHETILKLQPKTPLYNIASLMHHTLREQTIRAKTLHDSLQIAVQYTSSCQNLCTHFSTTHKKPSTPPTYLHDIQKTLKTLATTLYTQHQPRESLASLKTLTSLLLLHPSENASEIATTMNLTAFLALEFTRTKVSPPQTLFSTLRTNGTYSPHEVACDALSRNVVYLAGLPASMHQVNLYMALTLTHVARARYLCTLPQNTTVARTATGDQARLAKEHALCLVSAVCHTVGTWNHVLVVSALQVLVVAALVDGDQVRAWDSVKRVFAVLKEVWDVDDGNCFEVGGEGEVNEGWNGNEVLGEWFRMGRDGLLNGVVREEKVEFEREWAKRVCRRLLLGAEEIAKGSVGRWLGANVRFIKVVEKQKPRIVFNPTSVPVIVPAASKSTRSQRLEQARIVERAVDFSDVSDVSSDSE